jgi:sugar phosphate isomerase/epimerase
LALEERENEVRADVVALGATGTEAILVHAAPSPAEGMLALVELVRANKPRLVVVDPLFRLARVKDEKAYAETYEALGPLIDVARETDTHVMLLHPLRQGAEGRPYRRATWQHSDWRSGMHSSIAQAGRQVPHYPDRTASTH